ncbi:MAG: MmgE/PrpD family protein [Bacteroidales bacterium]|nr:MmgE/PrpD family protein [Bacteroidales bacterium]
MNDKFILEKLVNYYIALDLANTPDDVLHKAKMSFLDYLFVYIVGYNKGMLTQPILDYVKIRTKNSEVSILLSGIKTDLEFAILSSGLIAHSVELDDGHRFGTAHPAVVVIPTALAFGEKLNSSFGEILKAIIVGYDIMLRLSRSINPSHLRRGFHSTSTTGTIGSAATASVLMGFNNEQMQAAIAISGLFSSGLQEMLHSNPSSKALQVGRSAQSGATAALLAELGAKGPISLFEGQHGWIKAMSDSYNENDLLGEFGSRWEILNTYTKLYPTCRHCHHAIDLAIEAYHKGFNLENIAECRLITYSLGIAEVGMIRQPENTEEAMFSICYAVALALYKGNVTYEMLEENITNPAILNFVLKIIVESDSEMDRKYPVERACIIELTEIEGGKQTLSTHLPKGEPDTALSNQEYLEKFYSITERYIPKSNVWELYELVMKSDLSNSIIKNILSLIK